MTATVGCQGQPPLSVCYSVNTDVGTSHLSPIKFSQHLHERESMTPIFRLGEKKDKAQKLICSK